MVTTAFEVPTASVTLKVAVSPEVVFSFVNDFHQWAKWSPWEKRDPNMKKTFEGAPAGVGAVYSWSGNDKVGEGRMTITGSQPPSRLAIKLEFFKPWQATSEAIFTVGPDAGATKLTWEMNGNNDFIPLAEAVALASNDLVRDRFFSQQI